MTAWDFLDQNLCGVAFIVGIIAWTIVNVAVVRRGGIDDE